jgi:hypothetical protein
MYNIIFHFSMFSTPSISRPKPRKISETRPQIQLNSPGQVALGISYVILSFLLDSQPNNASQSHKTAQIPEDRRANLLLPRFSF